MMDRYRIVVNAVSGGTPPNQVFDYSGLRVTPNVYTTLEEIDTFAQAMLDVAKNGLPAARPRSQSRRPSGALPSSKEDVMRHLLLTIARR